jgi:23S rRNA (cytosine1962-C5)-methyltransferase
MVTPDTSVRRLAARVSKDAARHVRHGHPWVFDESVRSIAAGGAPGDLAVIFDDEREFMAIGLYDPDSPIRIRVLHHGRPTPIDESFWRARVLAALEVRDELVRSTATTGYRVVHGENDGLGGLVVDRYADVCVVKLYSAAWLPHLPAIVAVLAELLEPTAIVLRLSRNVGRSVARDDPRDGDVVWGELPDGPVLFTENGLVFEADVVAGQKTGFFLDQRDNRDRVRSRAAGKSVLDVCSASGGFSVAAAAGGATVVHSVDSSAAAIAAAERNMAHNAARPHVAECRHETSVGDADSVLTRLARSGERFGIVVVDPPSMASRKSQVEGALRAYARWCDLALEVLEPGGTLVQASCSSRVTSRQLLEVVYAVADERGMGLRNVTTTGHALDHPVGFPEGEYLSAVIANTYR